jgi:hypothetical protein
MNLRFQPQIFLSQKSSNVFPYRDPAASVSHSTRGALPATNVEFLPCFSGLATIVRIEGVVAIAIFYLKAIFSFALMQKKQKIKPPYFYPKNHRTNFPIATPAARVSHSTRGSLPSANAEILTVIFLFKNIRAIRASCCDYFFW